MGNEENTQEQAETQEEQKTSETEEVTEEKTETEVNSEAKEEQPKTTEEEIEKSGFDYKALEKEYFDNGGELSVETMEKLGKSGFDEQFINDFIEGKKALYEQELNSLAEGIGGREVFNTVIEWAGKNLDKNTIAAVNAITDKTILKDFILPVLKSKMDEKEGVEPTVKLQGNGKAAAADIFESQAQMFEAIRDPRYLKDSAYQDKVTEKIRISREAGIDLGI